jgi:small subunit ribosomal protein S4
MKLFLKGTKCSTPKCAVERRGFPPGQHGQLRVRLSNYGLQLREKQKVKRIYGVWERQFRRYFRGAKKARGVTGQMLLQALERRLDNVIYRLGFATSRAEARQLVRHRAVAVNGKLVDIPSAPVHVGDTVQIIPGRNGLTAHAHTSLEQTKDRSVPAWLTVDRATLKGLVVRMPHKDDVGLPIEEQRIVELYSK